MSKLTGDRRRRLIEKDENYRYRKGDRMVPCMYLDGETGEFIDRDQLENWTKVKAYHEIIENEYGQRIVQPYVFCIKNDSVQLKVNF